MLVLAAHLSERTNAFMDPLVTIDLFTAHGSCRRGHVCLSNNGIDVHLQQLVI